MLGLFRKRLKPEPSEASAAGSQHGILVPGTALYVDTENLQNSAQPLVETVIGQWPEDNPPLTRLNLYVRADRVALWDAWASSRFPQLAVTVTGIQHFTNSQSKNSADIAIAIDAVADFVMGTTQFVAVMSDDSDFMPLYAKVKGLAKAGVPFLWVMTDRTKMKASTIVDFFPNDHVHVVCVPTTRTRTPAVDDEDRAGSTQWLEMAEFIIQEVPVGPFKSVECQPIIESRWSTHPMASMPGQQFGVEFANNLWPILEGNGVKLLRTSPRKYEMTPEAKSAALSANGQEKDPSR